MSPEGSKPTPESNPNDETPETRQGEFDFDAGEAVLPTRNEEWQQLMADGIEAGRQDFANRKKDKEQRADERLNRPNVGMNRSKARRDQTSEVTYPDAPLSPSESLNRIHNIRQDLAKLRVNDGPKDDSDSN